MDGSAAAVRVKRRLVDAVAQLAAAPGSVGRVARRLVGWAEPDDIVELYRVLLGRDPGPAEVEAASGRHWRLAVRSVADSEEFGSSLEQALVARCLHLMDVFATTVDVTPEELDRLFQRTRTYWESAGSSLRTAYWSVLSTDDWLGAPSREQLLTFYETGRENAATLTDIATRVRPDFDLKRSRVLDFGCGVGRVLRHFVGEAASCEGWDVSRGHLQLLEENFSGLFGLDGSAYTVRTIESPHAPPVAGEFDLAYSLITLQHNSPPVMAQMLRILLRSLAAGGIALVHLPTAPAMPGYEFAVDTYLDDTDITMEMHALPRDVIFGIAGEEDASVVWARYTDLCGPSFVNELFGFVKASPVLSSAG